MSIIRDVPEHTWVKLAEGGRSENVSRKAGSTCSLLKGGSIEILGSDPEFGALVRYTLPPGEHAAGALCHDQALVFLPIQTVSMWPTEGEVRKQVATDDLRLRDAVKRITG